MKRGIILPTFNQMVEDIYKVTIEIEDAREVDEDASEQELPREENNEDLTKDETLW